MDATVLTQAPQHTRTRLIEAGVRLFGAQGFDATSVREISNAAGANIAAIKYHFGSKADLFSACVEYVGQNLAEAGPRSVLPDQMARIETLAPEAAQQMMRAILTAALSNAFNPDQAERVRFMTSQVMGAGRGIDRLVDRVFAQDIERLTALVARAEGRDPTDPAMRLRAVTLVLQHVGVVQGAAFLGLTMSWSDLPPHIPEIVDAILPLHTPSRKDTP